MFSIHRWIVMLLIMIVPCSRHFVMMLATLLELLWGSTCRHIIVQDMYMIMRMSMRPHMITRVITLMIMRTFMRSHMIMMMHMIMDFHMIMRVIMIIILIMRLIMIMWNLMIAHLYFLVLYFLIHVQMRDKSRQPQCHWIQILLRLRLEIRMIILMSSRTFNH